MSATLATKPGCCESECADSVIQQIPGPQGIPGSNGTNGVAGINSYTSTTANFTMPAFAATAVATVVESGWASIGQIIYLQNAGWLRVTAKPASTQITLQNIETATEYTENVAPATIVASGSTISPGGLQGPAGAASASTFNSLSPTTTKGDIIVDNGANSPLANDVRLGVGTDGQVLAAVAAQPTGLQWTTIHPNVATDNAIARYDGAAGTPVPVQTSKVVVTDDGALQASGSGGDPRGLNSVDLQTVRAVVTQVVSGSHGFLGSGRNNTISNNFSVVGGGDTNTASAANTVVGGGLNNTNNSTGGFVGGGELNNASAQRTTIAGGLSNTSSASYSFVGGGSNNTASGLNSSVVGGNANVASGPYSSVTGGNGVLANRHGQSAQGSGSFATAGDAQTSTLTSFGHTSDATPTEIFLDNATLQMLIPSDTTWVFRILIVARRTDVNDESAAYQLLGCIDRNAAVGTTALVGAVTKTVIAEDTAAWDVAATADAATGALVITVTGEAAKEIHWVARTDLTQVTG